ATYLQNISLSRLGRASVTIDVCAMVPSCNTPGQISGAHRASSPTVVSVRWAREDRPRARCNGRTCVTPLLLDRTARYDSSSRTLARSCRVLYGLVTYASHPA